MNIVCLLGSPRAKSNSSSIAKRFIVTAEELGAKVKTYTLNGLKYSGCQGCMMCKTKLEKCVLEDDLEEVLDAVQQADILLMASPVYYGDISSQLKGFIDRTFSYLKPDFMTNPNPFAFITNLTAGSACYVRRGLPRPTSHPSIPLPVGITNGHPASGQEFFPRSRS